MAKDNKDKPIIIKKIRKGGGGHHGGAWKVAYADFVTAMMAFFLLMWLLNMTSAEQKAGLAEYFKSHSILDGARSILERPMPAKQKPDNSDRTHMGGTGEKGKKLPDKQETVKSIENMVEAKLGEHKDQIMVDIVPEGVRVQITDNSGQPMFLKGQSVLQPWSAQALQALAEEIAKTGQKVVIEGHTDAVPYAGGGAMTNWELSTQRAMAARRALEYYNIPNASFSKIIGYADQELLYKDKPTDQRNRRINLILQFPDANNETSQSRTVNGKGAAVPAAP